MKKRIFIALAALLGLRSGLVAGNQEFLILADEAALTGGAVTAMGQDLGAGWYNPAGLAAMDRNAVKLSASVYGLRLFNLPNYLQASLPDKLHKMDITSSELISVPATIFIGRVLRPGLYLSFGILTPEDAKAREVNVFQTKGSDPDYFNIDFDYTQGVEFGYQDQIYDVGPSIGWKASETLRLGAGLVGHFRKSNFDDRAWADLRWDTGGFEAVAVRQEVAAKQTILSFLALLGAQWDMSESLTLGLRFRTPGLVAMYSLEGSVLTNYDKVNSIETFSFFDHTKFESSDYGQATEGSWRGTVALAKKYSKGWVTVEMDASDYSQDAGVGAVINWKAGLRHSFSETTSLGLGFHTDSAPPSQINYFGERKIDYVGGNIGLQFVTPYPLAKEGSKPLQVISTFGVRYVRGTGETRGIVMDPLLASGDVNYTVKTDVTVNEAAVYLGSGLLF